MENAMTTDTKSVSAPSKSAQVRYFINAYKIATPLVVLGMMIYFDYWGVAAWLYLALHGTYCLLWILKESTFRDKRFEESIQPVAGSIFFGYVRHVLVSAIFNHQSTFNGVQLVDGGCHFGRFGWCFLSLCK